MTVSDTKVVLDLGTTKVVCLAATRGEDERIRVESLASVGCRGMYRGVVDDVDQVGDAIDAAVRRVQQDLGLGAQSLTVSVAGAHLESVNSQGFVPIYPAGRAIRREDVLQVINHSRQLVMPPDREQIQALPREFRIDGNRGIMHPIGMPGTKLEVVTHVITGQTSLVQLIEKALALHSRRVEEMVVSPLASGLGVADHDLMELGCVVVDLGAGTTDVAVFASGAIALTASLPVAGNHITSDLEQLLKVSSLEAERLKLEHGSALAAAVDQEDAVEVHQEGLEQPRPMKRQVLAEIIESRVREIAGLVERQIERSGLMGKLPGGVLLTGGTSLLPQIEEAFASVLEPAKVRLAKPKVSGAAARLVDGPALSAAVGLARFALEADEQEFAPVSGFASWKDRIHALKSLFSGKP